MWCKTLCKNFDMLPNMDRSGKMGLFCSICCTTSHKVKQSGLVGKSTYVRGIGHLSTLNSFLGTIYCMWMRLERRHVAGLGRSPVRQVEGDLETEEPLQHVDKLILRVSVHYCS